MLSDAKFCGHCGFNINATTALNPNQNLNVDNSAIAPLVDPSDPSTDIPAELSISNSVPNSVSNHLPDDMTEPNIAANLTANAAANTEKTVEIGTDNTSGNNLENLPANTPVIASAPANAKTQLQQFSASLLHVQTNLNIEIPAHLPVVHIGKPNTIIPPDIDVSGFPDSDIVSRIHADIRAEGGAYYFEDTGSSNGTYVNNLPLPAGNRHKLRAGDRISLGKGDKVSFVFQLRS
jgi:predicted component of type VI protein secretion system